jgi:hypothetical protein
MKKFPLLAKGTFCEMTVCFTSENSGVIIEVNPSSTFEKGQYLPSIHNSCFDETFWQIIDTPGAKPANNNKKWTDKDLRTAFEDSCKFVNFKDLQDALSEPKKKTKEYEVETCECGAETPVEFMMNDEDGLRVCPECRIEHLNGIINDVMNAII